MASLPQSTVGEGRGRGGEGRREGETERGMDIGRMMVREKERIVRPYECTIILNTMNIKVTIAMATSLKSASVTVTPLLTSAALNSELSWFPLSISEHCMHT